MEKEPMSIRSPKVWIEDSDGMTIWCNENSPRGDDGPPRVFVTWERLVEQLTSVGAIREGNIIGRIDVDHDGLRFVFMPPNAPA